MAVLFSSASARASSLFLWVGISAIKATRLFCLSRSSTELGWLGSQRGPAPNRTHFVPSHSSLIVCVPLIYSLVYPILFPSDFVFGIHTVPFHSSVTVSPPDS